jgi:virginiamycin B lyase
MTRGAVRGTSLLIAVALAGGCGGGGSSPGTSSHSGGQPGGTSQVAPPAPVASMAKLRATSVDAVVKVGGAPNAPDWQATGLGAVWVANAARKSVQRIDPSRDRVTTEIGVGTQPCDGLAVGYGSVWAVDCENGALMRIDPRGGRVIARVRLQPVSDEGLITSGAGGVWVLADDMNDPSRSLLDRIDPSTNRITMKVGVPYGSTAAAFGFGAVWVTTAGSNTVERIDPVAGRVTATIKVHFTPRFLATGEGGVWVLNQSDGSVSHIDPASNTVAATIPANVPGDGGCIAAGEGVVWVTMPGTPVITIDPSSNRITARYTGVGGDCIGTGFGSAWLSNHELGNVWRIRPAG